MRAVPLQSSQIAIIAYAPAFFELCVQFKGGAWYSYADVGPDTVAYILFDPESQGKAFNRLVKAYPKEHAAKALTPDEVELRALHV